MHRVINRTMLAGITYDLRDHYRALGFPEEEVAEFDSIATINAIDDTLKQLGFQTERIGTVAQLAEKLVSGKKWDFIFNIAEGLYGIGREAQVPALCDAYQIPYTFSDPCVLSLTLNKELTKRIVRDLGLATPDFRLVRSAAEIDSVDMSFPLFVKPYAEGTGKGINALSIINDRKSLKKVCLELLAVYKQPVLVESYLSGREFTVGIIGTGKDARPVGILEVILTDKAEAGVYSYINKENSEELVQYRLADDDIAAAAAELALKSWQGIGCFDGGRVDIRCDESGKPYFLEVNPLAGLQPVHSDLPMICEKAGIPYIALIGSIVKSALNRYGLLDKAPAALKAVNIKDTYQSGSRVKKNSKKVVILHQFVPRNASEDERDVIVQRDEISASLKRLGFEPVSIVMDLNTESVRKELLLIAPVCVFNLVESLGGSDRLIGFVPALIDSLSLKYTGSGSEAMTLSGNKVLAKRIMRMAGIPTPFHFSVSDIDKINIPAGEYIIKSVFEHASIGIHEDSIVSISGKKEKQIIKEIASGYKSACFAEQYIDGREFNISLLEGADGPEVLPYAEIVFKNYPEDKPKIVGYKAKWDMDSFEHRNTVRNYEFQESDREILSMLERYSLLCWDVFGLKGYARVDFRVDKAGQPWVLEINANPCLASDAGFMAAAFRKGISFDQVISHIINL